MGELYEKLISGNIKENMKQNGHINLYGKVLILSDRLPDLALSLGKYIENATDATFLGVAANYHEIMDFMNYGIDYIIIAGYLDNEETYRELQRKHKDILIVIWDLLDDYVDILCDRYEIPYKFDLYNPQKEFMQYLASIKKS